MTPSQREQLPVEPVISLCSRDAVKGRSLRGRREGDWMTFLPIAFDAEVYHLQTVQWPLLLNHEAPPLSPPRTVIGREFDSLKTFLTGVYQGSK